LALVSVGLERGEYRVEFIWAKAKLRLGPRERSEREDVKKEHGQPEISNAWGGKKNLNTARKGKVSRERSVWENVGGRSTRSHDDQRRFDGNF